MPDLVGMLLESCSTGSPGTLILNKKSNYCLLRVNGEIVSFKVYDGSWKNNMLRPLSTKGQLDVEETKGRAAHLIGKIWSFTKTLKELRLIWAFNTFSNWIAYLCLQ